MFFILSESRSASWAIVLALCAIVVHGARVPIPDDPLPRSMGYLNRDVDHADEHDYRDELLEENLRNPVSPEDTKLINSLEFQGTLNLFGSSAGIKLHHLSTLEGMLARDVDKKDAMKRTERDYDIDSEKLREAWDQLKDEVLALFKAGAITMDYNVKRDHWVSCALLKVVEDPLVDPPLSAFCGRTTALGLPVPCRAADPGNDFLEVVKCESPSFYEKPNDFNTGKYECSKKEIKTALTKARQLRRIVKKLNIAKLETDGDGVARQVVRSARSARSLLSRKSSPVSRSSVNSSVRIDSIFFDDEDEFDDEIFVVEREGGTIDCTEDMLWYGCYGACCNTGYGDTSYTNFCTDSATTCVSSVPFEP